MHNDASPAQTELGRCKNCVHVIERIKQGYHYLLPNICEEILVHTQLNEEYATVRSLPVPPLPRARARDATRTCRTTH